MPKKGRAKEAKVNTPLEELSTKETLAHYNAVLMEEQNSKFALVLERLDVISGKFDALAERVDDLTHRVDVLTERVDALTYRVDVLTERVDVLTVRVDKIEGRLSTLEFAFRGLKDDMVDMEQRLSSKLNRLIARSDNHECRISAIETDRA